MKKSIVAAAVVAAAGMYVSGADVFAEEKSAVISSTDNATAKEFTADPIVEDESDGSSGDKSPTDPAAKPTRSGVNDENVPPEVTANNKTGSAGNSEGTIPAQGKSEESQTVPGQTVTLPPVTTQPVITEPVITDIEKPQEEIPEKQGWADTENGRVYYGENGIPLKGKQTIDGKTYYFDPETGIMHRGELSLGSEEYYFSEQEGEMLINSLQQLSDGRKVYYGSDGIMLKGKQVDIDGSTYFFGDDGACLTNALKSDITINDKTGTVYFGKDGKMVKGQVETAMGEWRYFSREDGFMVTGFYDLFKEPDNTDRDKTVYYGSDGIMKYGQVFIDNLWYCFERYNGAMVTDFFKLTDWYEPAGEKWVYYNKEANANGPKGAMLKGFQKINGETYYFDPVEGTRTEGQRQIGSDVFCFEINTGKMRTGLTVMDGSYGYRQPKTMLFNDGRNASKKIGARLTGLYAENGSTYFFGDDGACLTNALKSDITINDKTGTVYFGKDGKMVKGQVETAMGEWRYFSREDGFMVTGFYDLFKEPDNTDRDKTVYYGSDGIMKYGQVFIDNLWYCFERYNGAMVTDFFKLTDWYEPAGEKWVYYNKEANANGPKGAMLKGFQQINGETYYFDPVEGTRTEGQRQIDSYWYGFEIGTGKMLTGKFYLDDRYEGAGPKYVYYNPEGTVSDGKGRMVYGEIRLGDDRFLYAEPYFGTIRSVYVRNDGKTLKAYNLDGNWAGEVQGLYNNHWMYFDKEKNPVKNQLITLSTAQTDDGPKTVYYDENGYMVYGMRKIKDGWKFFKPGSGAMATNELITMSAAENLFSHKDQDSIFDADGNLVLSAKYVLNGREYEIDTITGAAHCKLPSWCYIQNGQVIFDAPGYPTQVASVGSKLGKLLLAAAECWDASFRSGGRNNNENLDCIGFVMRCYNLAFGMNIQANSVHDFVTARGWSYGIHDYQLAPGDLVVYRGTWTPVISHYTHSSIYLGNGLIMYMTYSGATIGSMYGIGYYGGGPAPREYRRIDV